MATKVFIGTDGNYGANGNWSPTNVPTTNDDVRLTPGAGSISSGLDQSAVAIDDFIGEAGYTGTIGSESGAGSYLQIDPNRFEWEGTGVALIDVGGATIPLQVLNAATATLGKRGLYLKGSGITVLNVVKGKVGLASRPGETATATTINVSGPSADLWIGLGVTTTTVNVLGGKCRIRCGATTVNIFDGEVYTEENGAITTVNMWGGRFYPNSTGTIGTLNILGGLTDFRKSSVARTVSAMALGREAPWTVHLNKEAVTYTAITLPDSMQITGGTIGA